MTTQVRILETPHLKYIFKDKNIFKNSKIFNSTFQDLSDLLHHAPVRGVLAGLPGDLQQHAGPAQGIHRRPVRGR